MSLGRARIAFAQGIGVWVLDAPDGFGDAQFHAHHAIQITVCLSGALELESDDTVLRGRAIAVSADVRHRFAAHGLLVFLFVEPESAAGRLLASTLFEGRPLALLEEKDLATALGPLGRTFADDLPRERLLAAGREALHGLAPTDPPQLTDVRIRSIIDHAIADPDRSLDDTARAVGVHLSSSRLRHLFVEQTGLAFKTYMLWLRLVRALEVYGTGQSLTQAAHAAGFADSAHFSRAFKRTFGLPATTLTRL